MTLGSDKEGGGRLGFGGAQSCITPAIIVKRPHQRIHLPAPLFPSLRVDRKPLGGGARASPRGFPPSERRPLPPLPCRPRAPTTPPGSTPSPTTSSTSGTPSSTSSSRARPGPATAA